MYDARQIANWFVRRAKQDNKKLSIMQLLKLAYISHGWHLEMYGTPLFSNRIEAWQHGPVLPGVYRAFRSQGVEISKTVPTPAAVFSPHVEQLLEDIFRIYGGLSPFKLSDMTHVDGGPWHKAISGRGLYAVIPDESIKEHYIQLRAQKSENADTVH